MLYLASDIQIDLPEDNDGDNSLKVPTTLLASEDNTKAYLRSAIFAYCAVDYDQEQLQLADLEKHVALDYLEAPSIEVELYDVPELDVTFTPVKFWVEIPPRYLAKIDPLVIKYVPEGKVESVIRQEIFEMMELNLPLRIELL